MRKGGGHDKGAGFERDMARRLSLWVSGGSRDDLLWRSASSGGRFTQNVKRGSTSGANQAGDLAAVDPLASGLIDRFAIECKCVAELHLQDLPFDRRSNIEMFWQQACKAAWAANRAPMLVAKQNRRPTLMGLALSTYFHLADLPLPQAVVVYRLKLALFDFEVAISTTRPDAWLRKLPKRG